jgi:hypothetical protein
LGRRKNQLIEEKNRSGKVIRHWTRFHLPYKFADGTDTDKAGWSEEKKQELENILAQNGRQLRA